MQAFPSGTHHKARGGRAARHTVKGPRTRGAAATPRPRSALHVGTPMRPRAPCLHRVMDKLPIAQELTHCVVGGKPQRRRAAWPPIEIG